MCELCPPKDKMLTVLETQALLLKLINYDLNDPHIIKLTDRLLETEPGPNLDKEYGDWEVNYRSK